MRALVIGIDRQRMTYSLILDTCDLAEVSLGSEGIEGSKEGGDGRWCCSGVMFERSSG